MRRRSIGAALGALAVAAVMTIPAMPAAARGPVTRVVDDDGRGSAKSCNAPTRVKRTIQSAINASKRGDIVLVCPGTYLEWVTIGAGKGGLTVRSVKPGKAVVVAPSTPPATLRRPGLRPSELLPAGSSIIAISGAHKVRLTGLALRARTDLPCAPVGSAVKVGPDADGAVLTGLRIQSTGSDTLTDTNGCGYQVGVGVTDSAKVTITKARIQDFARYGILTTDPSTSVTVSANAISFQHANEHVRNDEYYGIYVTAGSTASVLGNTLVGLATADVSTSLLAVGIYLYEAADGTAVRRNTVRYARYGMVVESSTGPAITGNTLRDSKTTGIDYNQNTGGVIRGNTFRGYTTTGILVEGGSSGVTIDDNQLMEGQGTQPDCRDWSTGGTAGAPHYGTLNTWTGNTGAAADPASDPVGICTA